MTVGFGAPLGLAVSAACEADDITAVEAEAVTEAGLLGEPGAVIDALSGRGAPVSEVLPGAPDLLGAFAAYMAS